MTKLILIRHAKTDYSIKDDYYRPLVESGLSKAKKIPAILNHISIDHIYSSPFVRSVHTILYLANQREKIINLCPNLEERKVGNWVDDFSEYSQKQWGDFNFKHPNGESLSEVQTRNIKEINQILIKHKDQRIVIGTHGTSLCTILNYYDKKIDFEYFQSVRDKMPMFMELTFNGMEYVKREILFG